MNWTANSDAFPLVLGGVLCLVLSIPVYRDRKQPIARLFLGLVFVVAFWSFGEFGQQGVQNTAGRVFWTSFNFTFAPFVAPLCTMFVLTYAGRQEWMTKPVVYILLGGATLTVLTMWTNQWHQMFYREITLDTFVWGPLFYVHLTFSYLQTIGALSVFLQFFVRAKDVRYQTVTLSIGLFLPFIVSVLFLSGVLQTDSSIDWTPLTFVVSIMFMIWGMYQGGVLNVSGLAQWQVVDNLPDPMFVFNRSGNLVQMNQLAQSLADRFARPKIELGSSVDLLLGEILWFHRAATPKNASYEIPVTDHSGSSFVFQASRSPLIDQSAQVNGYVVVLRDITDQKQMVADMEMQKEMAEDAILVARQANEFKSRLIARVSHEFRTPLGAVLGIAGMLDTGAIGELNPQQKNMNYRILANARRLTKLVDELLDQSQLDSSSIKLKQTIANPNFLVTEVVDLLSTLADKEGLYLNVEVDTESDCKIVCDLDRLAQVVNNLVGNALKFTLEGGVTVQARIEDNQWILDVIDTGIGIDDNAMQIVFLPFRQADETISRPFNGSGLGLSIAKQLTELMQGEISVESEVGVGSTFTLKFPLATQELVDPVI